MSAGIFPPLLPCSAEEMIYSVSVSLPAEAEEELQRHAVQDGNSWTAEITQALTLYREALKTPPDENERNVAWAMRQMQELCPSPPPKKLTAKQRERVRRRTEEEITELRAAGEVGNVILPEELYEFVRSKIEAGAFDSPSGVVIASIPFLRAERQVPG